RLLQRPGRRRHTRRRVRRIRVGGAIAGRLRRLGRLGRLQRLQRRAHRFPVRRRLTRPRPLCQHCESTVAALRKRQYAGGMSKTFVGSRLRQLRTERGLSQVALAKTLEISPSYLNQIEHDVRPLTVPVLLRISEEFGVDATFFSPQDSTRLIAEMREVLMDEHVYSDTGTDADSVPDASELAQIASSHPQVARAMESLHPRYRNATDQPGALTERRHGTAYSPGVNSMP